MMIYAVHPCMLGSSIMPYSIGHTSELAARQKMKRRAPSHSERSASRGDCAIFPQPSAPPLPQPSPPQQHPQMSVRNKEMQTIRLASV